MYDLSNPEVGAHDSSGSELCDFGADPDVVRESELSSNDEENSASCAMAKVKSKEKAKGKAKKAREKVGPKTKEKEKELPLPSYDIDVPDQVYGTQIPFTPTRTFTTKYNR